MKSHVFVAAAVALLSSFACNTGAPKADTTPAPSATGGTKNADLAAAPPPVPTKPPGIPAPPDVAQPPADAEKTASGLASKVITPGTGKVHPGPQDKVTVQYTGWTKGGEMFDTSTTRPTPISFGLDQVIPGWTEGLQLMVLGEKRRLWIPSKLAYGDTPRGGAPSGDLTFDVELVDIKPAPKPPPVPEDVKAPPASAKKTASGMSYRVLKAGTGKDHPKETSRVEVNYSGWTPDGKMFDSSITRGQTATFPLNGVIKGWTEGVQLMVVGEKTRFWIPSDLAYGDKPSRPGAPAGPLVFDIELISIK
jgi:peptidylprolyl isomerase